MSNRAQRRKRPKMIESQTAPCGCIVGTAYVDGEPTFVIEPCATDCSTYLYAVAETKRQGKPLELRSVN
jgi:hypothetical protein